MLTWAIVHLIKQGVELSGVFLIFAMLMDAIIVSTTAAAVFQ